MKKRMMTAFVAFAVLPLAVTSCSSGGNTSSTKTPSNSVGSASSGTGSSGATSPSTGAGGAVTTVTVGYHPDLHSSGMIETGNQQGYWDKVGLKIVSKEFSNGPTEMQALAGGDIQFGYIGPGATWLAASGKATVITVDSFSNGDYVIGQPDIKSLSQLKGKKIGYPEGTSGEMILRLALRKAGLSMDDIQKVPLSADAVVPAFVTKKIDVAAIWVPLSQTIKEKVPDANFLVHDADFSPGYEFPESWVVSPSLLKSNPDVVKKFLKGFAMANDYRMQHMDDVIKITSAKTNVPVDALKAQAGATKWISSADLAKAYGDGTADTWFQKLVELFHSMGELKSVPPTSQFTAFDLFPSSN